LALEASAGGLPLASGVPRGRALALPLAIGRRLLAVLATLLASSFVVYSSLYLAPGDPIKLLSGGRPLPPAAEARLSAEYHLDQPFFVRYWDWLKDVVHGDFGRSTVFHQDVSSLLSPRIGTTFFLVVFASLLIVLFGVGLGLLSGLGRRSTRTAVTVGTAVGMGIPSFVASILLIALFSVQLGWFPVTGSGSGLGDRLWHLTLPALALALLGIAYVARIAGVAITEEATQEHVTTATARGVPRPLIVRRHILRNALIPIVTVSGLMIASLIAGSAVVEQAFELDGIGSFLISSVNARDFPVVQAICLIIVVVFVVVNAVVDVLYRLLDPRLRGGS
jgi:peptide/nickel transport system permease protein